MLKTIKQDINAILNFDPAARSFIDVLFTYPGLHALILHRISHWLWRHKIKFIARLISYLSRAFTNIEIHPAAKIGYACFIDHGIGVVIGETSEIGNNVTLYQGVTLGGTQMHRGNRHPKIMDNVILGAGAKILGPITVHQGARVGSNAVVLKDVEDNTAVIGIPAKVIPQQSSQFKSYAEEPHNNNDALTKSHTLMLQEINSLKSRLEKLEKEISDLHKNSK